MINNELKTILDKYINTYFRPALGNIRDNNGQSSVSEEHIQSICRRILEEVVYPNTDYYSLRRRDDIVYDLTW